MVARLLTVGLLTISRLTSGMLWFPRPPNNLADLDGLTTSRGEFWLRYDNGACGPQDAAPGGRCAAGPGGHCAVGIHSFGGAHSQDGIHWNDAGTMMDASDGVKSCPQTNTGSGAVWKRLAPQSPLDEAEEWVINYSEGAVIYFMTGSSPGGPWRPVGANHTAGGGWGPGHVPLRPLDGGQWYQGCWNTLNAWTSPASGGGWKGAPAKMFGWNTGYAKPDSDPTHAFGFASSIDGLNWTAQPPARIIFDNQHNRTGPSPLENGGCAWAEAAKRWICLLGFRGSWASVDGHQGMAAFSSPAPGGPYTIAKRNALFMAYKNSQVWSPGGNAPTYFARFWTRYDSADPAIPPELLVVHMSYTGTINDKSDNMIYLAPLKQAQVDPDGSMRLLWWPGNEKLKGPIQTLPAHSGTRILANNRNGTVLEIVWPSTGSSCSAGSVLIYPSVATQNLLLSPPPPPLTVFDIGVDKDMQMRIYSRQLNRSGQLLQNRTLLETGDRGIPVDTCCHVRVLVRGSMCEVYVNDVLLLPVPLMNTVTAGGLGAWAAGVRAPEVEIGLAGSWAAAETERTAWMMDLPALFPME
eukprot:SAG31_NODE_3410_length_4306_cov_1.893035_2_plen_579_part_00